MIVAIQQKRESLFSALANVEVDGRFMGHIYPANDYNLFNLGYIDLVLTLNSGNTKASEFIRLSCKPADINHNLHALYRDEVRWIYYGDVNLSEDFPEHWADQDAITSDNVG